jgi:hypothetical protein
MKSAYELAMERLSKSAPTIKVTSEKKKQLAELDSFYSAKLAERELFLKGELDQALMRGDPETIGHLQKQMVSERKSIHAELEEKKESIRTGKDPSTGQSGKTPKAGRASRKK